MSDDREAKGSEFLRRVKKLAEDRGLDYRFEHKRGKGSHGTLYFGGRMTIVQDPQARTCDRDSSRDVKTDRSDGKGSRIGGVVQSFLYPAQLIAEKGKTAFTVRFRDLPEAITSGKTRSEALAEAADCLGEAIAARIDDRRDIPAPSPAARNQVLIAVPAPMASKAALYLAIRDLGLSNLEVARRLRVDEKEIRRMLDPRHTTRLARIEELLELVGKRIVISLCEA